MLKPDVMYSFKCDPDGDQYMGEEILDSIMRTGDFLGFVAEDFFPSDSDADYVSYCISAYSRKA